MPKSRNFRPYPGVLLTESVGQDVLDVFCVPSKERLDESKLASSNCDPEKYSVKLLSLDGSNGALSMFPTQTSGRSAAFLKPLYRRVSCITLKGPRLIEIDFSQSYPSCQEDVMSLLDQLPNCFVKGYDYGLGFRQDFYPIIETVERLSFCSAILISEDTNTRIRDSNEILCLSYADFQAMLTAIRKTMRNSTSRGRSFNVQMLEDFLSDRLRESPTLGPLSSRRSTYLEPLPVEPGSISVHDRIQVLSTVAESASSIAASQPEHFDEISRAFDLARLDALITEYELMMNRRSQETEWQRFFERYTFLLSLALGYPIVFVQKQPSLGGSKLDGSGDKYGDFLYKNSKTNNSVIVELKTPRTKLLNTTAVRDGVYGPSSALTGGLAQVLNQRGNFQKSVSLFKENSRIHDIESYAVRGCLIIGTLPADEDMKSSFELYRGNSKDVEIVTFDELLERVRQVKEFLTILGDEQ